jgi:hypothetical protein
MTDAVLAELFRALNLVAIERQPNHTFYLLTPAPSWLSGAFASARAGERHTLAGALPFLDDFLHQADGAWNAGPHASIVSGPFAASVDGDDLLLRASALTVDGRALLVLERLVGAADTRSMLQKARQHMLDNEQLTRQAARIHQPAKAIADAIDELQRTSLSALSAEQRGIVERLNAASAELTAAAETLPRPPAKGRAPAR